MSSSFDRFQKRRLINSYFSVVFIIALLLLLVGTLLLLAFKATDISNHFKERMAINIFIKDGVTNAEITQLEKELLLKPYTRTLKFVSKTEAAEVLSKEIGEDFMTFLGKNPLRNSIDVYLKADYVTAKKVNDISKNISKLSQVFEVSYDKPLVSLINENTKKIFLWIAIITLVFVVIAILVINSSIRLSIYSQRFIIKTMQMVGAGKGFIRRPFVRKNIKLGFVGAFLAIIFISIEAYYLDRYVPELYILDPWILTKVFANILILGIFISWVSTFFAAQRFLNLKVDDLY